jgi:poly-gamma-glutamate synthesis protein (capsule biosynthesis protein)
MIFLGDVAYPGNFRITDEYSIELFKEKTIVLNLEGPIVDKTYNYRNDQILFNSNDVFEQFEFAGILVANLANNHILDLGSEGLEETIKYLKANEIIFVGTGKDKKTAAEAKNTILEDTQVSFLSFGWSVIQCETANLERPGVNPLEAQHVISSVTQEKKKNPDSKLVVMFHWNYELEKYPQPTHRELAKKLIDLGVDLIVGHHPHIVNGIEIYRGKPIVYSLGNWFIPHNYFWAGKLSYPEVSNIQLAFEWNIDKNKYVNHWFKFDPNKNQINYLESKNLEEDNRIKKLTPFSGMNKDTYEKWFRKNRIKKKGLPIYKWNDSRSTIRLKNEWVMLRDRLIQLLLKMGLK